MNSFDLATAYVITGMLYLVMPLTIGYALRRVKERSVLEWCLGGVLFGAGLLLMGQRGNWPDPISYELAVFLLIGAQLLRVCALSREN